MRVPSKPFTPSTLLLVLEHLLDRRSRVRLGALEGYLKTCVRTSLKDERGGPRTSTERTVPNELGSNTERTRDTEEDSVELHLVQAIVREEHTRVRINVRPWVLRLTSSEQNVGHDLVYLRDELEHGVVRQVLERELALGSVARVRLAEDGVAIPGDDLAVVQRRPDILLDGLVGCVLADLGLHPAEPDKHLLVRETVKGTSKTIQGSTEGEERVRERGADKLASVRGNIATLVITALRQ